MKKGIKFEKHLIGKVALKIIPRKGMLHGLFSRFWSIGRDAVAFVALGISQNPQCTHQTLPGNTGEQDLDYVLVPLHV